MTEVDDKSNAGGQISLASRLLANAMGYRPAPLATTGQLRSLAHDADLVPKVQTQLNRMMHGFQRDTNVTYEVQGFNDAGTDVVLKLISAVSTSYIGLQIKSDRELRTEARIPSLLREQLSRSEDRYVPLLHWYVLLAGDISHKDDQKIQKAVRAIQSELATRPRVTIVSPQYVSSFLDLSGPQLDSLIAQTMQIGNPVYLEAQGDLQRHPVESALLLRAVCQTVCAIDDNYVFDILGLRSDRDIVFTIMSTPTDWWPQGGDFTLSYREDDERSRRNYDDDEPFMDDLPSSLHRTLMLRQGESLADVLGEAGEDRVAERFAGHIDALEDDLQLDHGRLFAPMLQHRALFALALEAQVKHEYSVDELFSYLVEAIINW